MSKIEEIRKRLEDYEIQPSYEADIDGASRDIKTLLDMLDEAREVIEFYASALDLPEEQSPFGEPNKDPFLMPCRLGTRAREFLKKMG